MHFDSFNAFLLFQKCEDTDWKTSSSFFSGSDQLEKNFCRDLCFVVMFVLLFFIVVMFVAPVLWLVSLAAVRLYLGGEKLNGMKHIKWEMGWD